MSDAELEVLSLSKSFGSLRALEGVSLQLAKGSVHALLGENGAGKSTLVKCIMGYHHPDEGRIRIGGTEITPRSPREAQVLGIGMVYQHFTLVPNMTVCENLVLSRPSLPFLLDWPAEQKALGAFLDRMPLRVDPHAPVRSLSAGEKQKVEILKQLYLKTRVLILDEPTSVLTPAEADDVLTRLRTMAQAGEVSILIITHKFREVTQYADDVTVLRRGREVGHGRVADLTTATMASMMMGGSAAPATSVNPPTPPAGSGSPSPAEASPALAKSVSAPRATEARLRVVGLEADDDAGIAALRGVSFEVSAGEIVGVAAIAGNGQEELVEVLAGQRPRRAGRVMVSGQDFSPTRRDLHAHKVRCLPEEPLRSACVPTMSVAENLVFRVFDRPPYATVGGLLSESAVRSNARRAVAEYGIRAPSILAPIEQLSGGNVQRVVLARELSGEVDVLIAANPCMGLDFAAVSEIHARIRTARDRGTAVLLISADLDEIFALAERILVMSEGRVVHEARAESAEATVLGKYMAGHGAEH